MILAYIETQNGIFKKNALEVLSYACALGKLSSKEIVALTINAQTPSELEKYGASRIICVNNPCLDTFSAKTYCAVIEQVAKKINAETIVLSSSPNARYIAPILAIRYEASYLSNITSLPDEEGFSKTIFSSKIQAKIQTNLPKKIIGLAQNSFGIKENLVSAKIENFSFELTENQSQIKKISDEKNGGKVSISEASIVVSAGRGLKAPENWHLVENLAEVLGAATACTKPVSDMGWRPHSEHVGQTGKPVACDLYIAIGISGAIQHLAGVNASKVKVVINSDPEAPFFKAADYGIVGDAFEIVPRLTEKLKSVLNK